MQRIAHILSARLLMVAMLPLCAGVLRAQSQQDAPPPPPQAAAITAEQQRDQRLRHEASQLNDLAQQLQQEMRKAGNDKLSLEAVRLAEQVRLLSKQIQAELRQP